MIKNVNINNVLRIYDNEICRNVKNKNKLAAFERNKMQNVNLIMNALKTGNYNGGHYNIFLIREPKHRIVMSLNLNDKIINHFFTRYVLEPKLSKYLCDANVATRKNMGTDYAIKKVKRYIELNKKHGDFYVLKLDISKYFYSIDHNVLKNMIKGKISNYEYLFLEKILYSTNYDYVNKSIERLKRKYLSKFPIYYDEVINIPKYEFNKGLPIGNLTSQFLSIFYLYELDHYIIHNLKCKYYVRYMDDFIIIDNDKNKLKKVLKEIINILNSKYLLNINANKTSIVNIKNGFQFLGYNYRVINNKTVLTINSSSYKRIKTRIKSLDYLFNHNQVNLNQVFCSIMSFWNNRKYGSALKVRRLIQNYYYE